MRSASACGARLSWDGRLPAAVALLVSPVRDLASGLGVEVNRRAPPVRGDFDLGTMGGQLLAGVLGALHIQSCRRRVVLARLVFRGCSCNWRTQPPERLELGRRYVQRPAEAADVSD
ncbi:hypothetical protein ACWGCW_08030 [Streptomyces sp. NPDC054933]